MRTLVKTKDITFEPVKGGIHAGGQHAQKNATGVRATHVPSGIVVVIRGRSLKDSKRKAVAAIRTRFALEARRAGDKIRKARWKRAINDRSIIRTYHFPRNEVVDHRTGAKAPLSKVLGKGEIGRLNSILIYHRLKQMEEATANAE